MSDAFLREHFDVTRRFFLRAAAGSAVALLPAFARAAPRDAADNLPADCAAACKSFLAKMEYLTPQEEFGNVSRGNPKPYTLSDEKKREVGLTPDSWQLEVVSDPENPADLGNPLTKQAGNALNWQGLMKLAEQRTVRFAKVITCNNIGRPLGMGIWEGVPLRDIVWLTQPKQNLRRVFYHGYHNDDPAQMFRSSLPVGRVLEDPFDLPPVILCFKLNGQLLTAERGGPVRVVVPETYGFKSVKWLNRVILSNISHANDTYASGNNDLDSGMKTFARSLLMPEDIKAGQPIPITGYAQVGISGLRRVQTCVLPQDQLWPEDDPYFTRATWTDAHILPPPQKWGAGLSELPSPIHNFKNGQPQEWPLTLTMAHWATLLPGLPSGEYTLRCRSIDSKNIAQPMPRPFAKSGRNAIEEITLKVV